MNNSLIFGKIYEDLYFKGEIVYPRGLKVREIENYNYVLPPYCRFQTFAARKLSISYIKKEFLWYLKGEKFDTSIAEHAKMWTSLINADGAINSNYGRYIFTEMQQFDNVVNILTKDKDSRKASIVILSSEHLKSADLDTPCTYSINFRIRKNKLNMTVRMRSQDAILGMGNDAPAFSFVHEMMYQTLKEVYPELEYGEYYHSADSFHIYEKHFDMLEQIIQGSSYVEYVCPRILNADEVRFLRKLDFTNIPPQYQFTTWLTT